MKFLLKTVCPDPSIAVILGLKIFTGYDTAR